MSKFHTRLKKLRIDSGYTQEQLAKKLGITKSRLGMYEIGQRNPDVETLELIADFFNVDMNYLLGKSSTTTKIQLNDTSVIVNNVELDATKKALLQNYENLNFEGQQKLKTYSDDLISSGRYSNEQQITLVAARGDSNKAVDIKKSDVEDDMKNYIPPDDL